MRAHLRFSCDSVTVLEVGGAGREEDAGDGRLGDPERGQLHDGPEVRDVHELGGEHQLFDLVLVVDGLAVADVLGRKLAALHALDDLPLANGAGEELGRVGITVRGRGPISIDLE